MERRKISDMHAGIVMALLDKRARVNAELGELVVMLCRQYNVDDSWLLVGNPKDGFALVPPEEALPNETDT